MIKFSVCMMYIYMQWFFNTAEKELSNELTSPNMY